MKKNDVITLWTRWFARGLGLLMSGCSVITEVLVLTDDIGNEFSNPFPLKTKLLLTFIAFAVASSLLIWVREKTGGILTIICAFVIGITSSITSTDAYEMIIRLLLFCLPFILIGIFAVFASLREQASKVSTYDLS